jgi:hypothetical protein
MHVWCLYVCVWFKIAWSWMYDGFVLFDQKWSLLLCNRERLMFTSLTSLNDGCFIWIHDIWALGLVDTEHELSIWYDWQWTVTEGGIYYFARFKSLEGLGTPPELGQKLALTVEYGAVVAIVHLHQLYQASGCTCPCFHSTSTSHSLVFDF